MLDKAIELAHDAHLGQFDSYGLPYISHPLRVMENVDTIDEKIIAILHDVVEKTDVSFRYLEKNNFGKKILNTVRSLTRLDNEDYEDYISRLSLDHNAIKIKLKDLEDNILSLDNEKSSSIKSAKLKKYSKAKKFLLEKYNIVKYQ